MALTLEDLRAIGHAAAEAEGEPLDALGLALVALGIAVSVAVLDRAAIERAIDRAFAAGASAGQVQEVVSLVSGLGVHSLMASAPAILARAGGTGAPLSADQRALWDRHVGDDPYWLGFERECPGFLDALLRLSPDQFEAFFLYCAVPWKGGEVRARLKELIALAVDATPAHRFGPGFRLHLRNAVALGAGRRAIGQALDIAAAAPQHEGYA